MQKAIIIFLITIMFSMLTAEIMTIHLSSGEIVAFDTAEIEEITFGPDVSVDEMVEIISQIPIKFLKNHPNPFNPITTISFEIGESGKTQIEIYNIKGQKIKTLLDEEMEKGHHSVIWEGNNDTGKRVASGMYFYKVSIGSKQKIKKMLMLK